jgi:glucuronoarabinoxylan endo-1,4-beta-xylanase
MPSPMHRTNTRKGYCKLLLSLGIVFLTTQLFNPTTSLYAQKADRLHPTASPATVTINGSQPYQTIDGFGISEAFGQAEQIRTLSSQSDQKQILDLLFNTSTGAGFSILRNLLPSDYFNTIEPKDPGGPNATPQYQWDHNSGGQIWLSKQAQTTYGVKQFYLDAWSAPGYMKTNGTENNGGTLCGVPGTSCPSGDWRQAYANYLAQYIRDYQSEGIPTSYIGPVNEPGFTTGYSSMDMTPAQMADFDTVLGQALHASQLHSQIVCCDTVGWRDAQNYADAITQDPTANNAMSIISSHGYSAAPNFPLTGIGQKHTWETEWGTLGDQWDPNWDDNKGGSGFSWAQNIYTGLTAANLNAFFFWWGLGFNVSDDGVLMRYQNHALEISKRLWAFANYSRFVRQGAIRIGATTTDNELETTAFKNTDGSLSLVVLNTASSDIPVAFSLQKAGITPHCVVTPYLTDTSHDTAAQAQLRTQQQQFSATVPARSLVTYQVSCHKVERTHLDFNWILAKIEQESDIVFRKQPIF